MQRSWNDGKFYTLLHSKFCRNSQTAITFHDNVEQQMSRVKNVLTIAVVPSQLFPTPQILNNNRSETVRNKCPDRNVTKSPNQLLDKLISCFTSLNETRSNHTNNVKIINRTKTMFRCSQNQIVIWKSECESDAWQSENCAWSVCTFKRQRRLASCYRVSQPTMKIQQNFKLFIK